mgnify:FL=1
MKKLKNVNVLSILCAVVFVLFLSVCSFNILFPLKYKNIIKTYAKENDISPSFIASIIKTESNFNPAAESKKGAIGLMQIMPSTGKWIYENYYGEEFDEKMLYDAEINIKIGVKYLSYLFEKYDDKVTVLACYNAGEGVVKGWIAGGERLEKTQILFAETEKYVQNVENAEKIYKLRIRWLSFIILKFLAILTNCLSQKKCFTL